MPTVIDVARRAGVSLATVSRALNGKSSVAAELRAKVSAAARALDYRPNPHAQGLRKGQGNSVALLVGDIAQRHFAELTMHVQSALEAIGADLLLFNLGHSESRLKDFLRRAPSMKLRAVTLALSDTLPKSIASLAAALQPGGVPVISIGQDLSGHGIASIVHEEQAAAGRSVTYLLGKGHSRIAYIGRIRGSAIGGLRFAGYRAALKRAGRFDPALVWDRSFRYAAGRDAVLQALDRAIDFSAIQAGSDEIAMGAIAGLQDRGRGVPRDVAVVGFGDVEMGAYLRPALTTLSSHPELAALRLSCLLKRDGAVRQPAGLSVLERTLVERESA